MEYPVNVVQLQALIAEAMRADAICGGVAPGFFSVSSTQPGASGASAVGDRRVFSFDIDALQALGADGVADLLDDDVVEEFVASTTKKVLSIATEVDCVHFARWGYEEIVGQLGTPAAVIFPWWRAKSRTLPSLPVMARGSRAVPHDQALWIIGGSCRFAANDKISVDQLGSRSTIHLPASVWRIDRGDVRYVRVVLTDPTFV